MSCPLTGRLKGGRRSHFLSLRNVAPQPLTAQRSDFFDPSAVTITDLLAEDILPLVRLETCQRDVLTDYKRAFDQVAVIAE